MITTFVAKRRNKMGADTWREVGELVPEAHLWPRVWSNVHTGYLREVTVSEAEFRAAVDQYCPDIADAVLGKVGLPVLPPVSSVKITPPTIKRRRPAKAPEPVG